MCLRYFGATGGVWLITAISVLTLHEFYAMLERMGSHPFHRVGLLLGAAITLAPRYFGPYLDATDLLALGVIVSSVRILGERAPHDRVETLAWTIFGLVYVPFMLQFLVRIVLIAHPQPHTGLVLGLWLIAVTKFCDSGALLTGLAIGRHKLAPGHEPEEDMGGRGGRRGACRGGRRRAGLGWPRLPARGLHPAVRRRAASRWRRSPSCRTWWNRSSSAGPTPRTRAAPFPASAACSISPTA